VVLRHPARPMPIFRREASRERRLIQEEATAGVGDVSLRASGIALAERTKADIAQRITTSCFQILETDRQLYSPTACSELP
jgi:hypothetical protein